MPKEEIKDFSGGINTRLDRRRVAVNESQDCTNVDLAGVKLKASKGLNTGSTPEGDYKTHGVWVSDEEADTFTEQGDVVIKSYASKSPEFVTVDRNGQVSSSLAIGVPSTPKQPQIEKLTSSSSGVSSENSLAYWTSEWGEKATKKVASTTNDGNPTDIVSISNASTSENAYVSSNGNTNIYDDNAHTVKGYNSSNALQFTTSVLHYSKEFYFTNDYFIGVSHNGITKISLSNGAGTNHTFATPSWPTYQGSGTNCRDGYQTAPTVSSSSKVTSSTDNSSIYVSVEYDNGEWGYNHYQRHPDQLLQFPQYIKRGNQKEQKTFRLKGPAYYVGIFMDTAFYTGTAYSNENSYLEDYYNRIMLPHGRGSFVGGWRNDFAHDGSIPSFSEPNNTVPTEITYRDRSKHPLQYFSNTLHWGIADVGDTYTGTPVTTDGAIQIYRPEIWSDPWGNTTYKQTSANVDARGLYHGQAESVSYSDNAYSSSNSYVYQKSQADSYVGAQWNGGIFYVPKGAYLSLEVGAIPFYLWKCGVSWQVANRNSFAPLTSIADDVEAVYHGGENCYSKNNTTDGCTDFYVRHGYRKMLSAGSVGEGDVEVGPNYDAGILQLKVYHDLTLEGHGLKFTTSDGTELVKGISASDHYNFFGSEHDATTYSIPSSRTNLKRKETVIHKLALSASNATVPTLKFESLPNYKIADKTYNYSSTPWHHVNEIKQSNFPYYPSATVYNKGNESPPTTTFTYTGFQGNQSQVINPSPYISIKFRGDRTKINSANLPFEKIVKYKKFLSGGRGVATDSYNSDLQEEYVGVKVTTSSFADDYFSSESNTISQDLSLESSIRSNYFANQNGIALRTGTGEITIRPLGASFSSTVNFTKVVDAFSDVQIDSDYISFYNPKLTILKLSDGTKLDRSNFNISEEVKTFSLLGSPTSGHIGYNPEPQATSLKIVDITNSNRIAVYQVPFSKLTSTGSEGKMRGLLWDSANQKYSKYKECWVWYLDELANQEVEIGIPNASASSFTIKEILYKTTDENQVFFLMNGVTGNSNYFVNGGTLIKTFSVNRSLHLALTSEQYKFTTSSALSSSTDITGCTQEIMRTVQENDYVTGTGISSTNVSVNSKSGTTLTLSSAQTISGGTELTFTRWVNMSSFWPHENDYQLIQIQSSFPNFSNSGAGYTGANKIQLFLNTPAYMPTQKKSRLLSSGIEDGRYAYKIDGSGNKIYYFQVNLDQKQQDEFNGTWFTSPVVWFLGQITMYNANANVDFQYKVSALRNIGTSTNPRYIESAPSSDSNVVQLGASNDYIALLGSTLQTYSDSTIDKLRIYRVGGAYASYGWLKDISTTGGLATTVNDFSALIGSTALTPLNNVGPVPEDRANGTFLRFVTYVSGLFYGAYDKQLRVSEYGNPHSWPALGYHDLYGTITGIKEYNGEAIVFTENSTYRVRGSSFDDFTVNKIPERQGLPQKNRKSVIEILNALFWISNDGVCMYQNGQISVISQSYFSDFPTLDEPIGGAKDNILHFFTKTGKGLMCDLRKGAPIFSRVDLNIDKSVYYSQEDDQLFVKSSTTSGAFGAGNQDSLSFKSKVYDGNDSSVYKLYSKFQITYKGSGTITFTFDGNLEESFTLPNEDVEKTRFFEFNSPQQAKEYIFEVTGTLEVTELDVEQDLLTNFEVEQRWEFADIIYIGECTLTATVDGEAVTLTPVLASSATAKTVRVYFPATTIGYIAHLKNTGSGDLISTRYSTSEV